MVPPSRTLLFCVGCVTLLLYLWEPSVFFLFFPIIFSPLPLGPSVSVLFCVGCVVLDPLTGHRIARFLFAVSSLSLPSSGPLAFRLVLLVTSLGWSIAGQIIELIVPANSDLVLGTRSASWAHVCFVFLSIIFCFIFHFFSCILFYFVPFLSSFCFLFVFIFFLFFFSRVHIVPWVRSWGYLVASDSGGMVYHSSLVPFSLTDWYDTAVRTISYWYAFVFFLIHLDAFLLQLVSWP